MNDKQNLGEELESDSVLTEQAESSATTQNNNLQSDNTDIFLNGGVFSSSENTTAEPVKASADDSFEIESAPASDEEFTPVYSDAFSDNTAETVLKNQSIEIEAPTEQVVPPQFAQQQAPQYFNPYANNQKPNGAPINQGPTYNPYAAPQGQQNNNMPPFSPYPPAQNNTTPPSSKGKKIVFALIGLCLLISLAIMFTRGGNTGTSASTTNSTTQAEVSDTQAITNTTQAATTTPIVSETVNSIWVAEKVRPSVVGVMTYKNGQLAGEGSGVLWGVDSSGEYTYIVTCAHVIDGDNLSYGILLLNGTHYEAEMVASDAKTDIGVLKVKATGLPVAELGDSSSLKIGEPVYAIGNPGGSEYFGSITNGIVSAIDRSINATYTMTCIQHNAAINPGNSGGALVNTAGQIVGINSSKITSTDYEGMGFAVPMSIVKPIVEALIQYKYVPNRPKLGIEYADVSSYQLYSIVVSIKGLPQGSLVIAGISPDSTLANTEAQVGDLIIAVNGKDMNDSSVLLDLIDTGAVGDTLVLTLCRIEERTYKTHTFDVTITLVEDKGVTQQEQTTTAAGDYYYGGAESFDEYFERYFGFGW